ncbi:HNH endonuclease [Mycolicibacterium fortuitum]|uniref:HNH endonuclease n=1 Tax=Mycolicibacterium fortuitum TaxID=1766 RepID=UPI0009432BEF|nr:HNH endonuclease [Mycolicibacterium fortuitum]
MSTVDARYSSSSEQNRLLLFALVQAWGDKCYWCRTPKTFRDMQIDHMLPQNPRGGTNQDFDVNAASNLAPICGACNQEKGNGEFEDAPKFDAARKRAAELAPRVQRNLERFHQDASVVRALLAVSAADLESEDVAESVESFGAAILPVFREKFPQILDAPYTKDYTVQRPPLEVNGRQIRIREPQSTVDLDVPSRRALVILEDVLEIPMGDAFSEIRSFVGDRIDDEVEDWLRDGGGGRYDSADLDDRPSSNPIEVYVREVRYADDAVTLTGELEGMFTANLRDHPIESDWLSAPRSADFDFAGEFSATFSREGLTDWWVYVGEPDENEWLQHMRRIQFEDD